MRTQTANSNLFQFFQFLIEPWSLWIKAADIVMYTTESVKNKAILTYILNNT